MDADSLRFRQAGRPGSLANGVRGVLCAGLLSGDRRLARAGVRMLAADALAGFTTNWVKRRIERTRPMLMIRDGEYQMGFGRSPEHERRSFPSGHSACAVAVGRAFTREYPEYSGLPELAAALIALSQIPRGKHYPTDVGAGSALGILSEWLLAATLFNAPESLTRADGRQTCSAGES